jgi:hypothetical protein
MARKSRSKKSKKTTSKSTWLVVPAMPWDNPADFTGPNAKQIKLSIHPKIGAYRKYIGGRNWQLGKDPAKAARLAWEIQSQYKMAKAVGHEDWLVDMGDGTQLMVERFEYYRAALDGDEKAIKRLGLMRDEEARRKDLEAQYHQLYQGQLGSDASSTTQPGQPLHTSLPRPTGIATLSRAVEAFKDVVDRSSRSPYWKSVLKGRVEDSLAALGDQDLVTFGYDALSTVVEYWISQAKAGQVSVHTAENQVGAIRQFVDWLDQTDKTSWLAPRRWEKLLQISKRQEIRRIKRSQSQAPETYDTKQLKKLWLAATGQTRLYLLLGLNCAFTQIDLSELNTDHLDLKADKIEYRRSKTGVYAEFPMWPETRRMLQEHCKQHADDIRKRKGLLFVTRQGRPLVHLTEAGNRSDAVRQRWNRLRDNAGVKGSFKLLRKTASQYVRNAAGADYAEALLAHAEQGVGASYNRFQDWPGLAKVVMEYRNKLQPVFDQT